MNKKFVLIAVVMAMATACLADTVTLQLVAAPYGQTGPYTMKLDGLTVPLVCGSDQQFISVGETWTADVYTINNITSNSWFTTQTQAQWNYASLFADLLLQHPGDGALQNDVWAALGLGGSFDGPSGWQGVVDNFLSQHQGYLTTDLFYIPIEGVTYDADHGYPYGLPQPFIGPVPEPSSLTLFGSGLIAAAGLVRRRMRV